MLIVGEIRTELGRCDKKSRRHVFKVDSVPEGHGICNVGRDQRSAYNYTHNELHPTRSSRVIRN